MIRHCSYSFYEKSYDKWPLGVMGSGEMVFLVYGSGEHESLLQESGEQAFSFSNLGSHTKNINKSLKHLTLKKNFYFI